jgi:hypothetical protein
MLTWTGLAWGQQRPAASAPAMAEGEHFLLVGDPPQKCRVLAAWHLQDGRQAYDVQALDSGEKMTLFEAPGTAGASNGGMLSKLRMRIAHWGREHTRPAGFPAPPISPAGAVVVNPPIVTASCACDCGSPCPTLVTSKAPCDPGPCAGPTTVVVSGPPAVASAPTSSGPASPYCPDTGAAHAIPRPRIVPSKQVAQGPTPPLANDPFPPVEAPSANVVARPLPAGPAPVVTNPAVSVPAPTRVAPTPSAPVVTSNVAVTDVPVPGVPAPPPVVTATPKPAPTIVSNVPPPGKTLAQVAPQPSPASAAAPKPSPTASASSTDRPPAAAKPWDNPPPRDWGRPGPPSLTAGQQGVRDEWRKSWDQGQNKDSKVLPPGATAEAAVGRSAVAPVPFPAGTGGTGGSRAQGPAPLPSSRAESTGSADPFSNPSKYLPPAVGKKMGVDTATPPVPAALAGTMGGPSAPSLGSGGKLPPGAQSVLAASNGMDLPRQYVPVPIVTVPQVAPPQVAPAPQVPQPPAHAPEIFSNAWSSPEGTKSAAAAPAGWPNAFSPADGGRSQAAPLATMPMPLQQAMMTPVPRGPGYPMPPQGPAPYQGAYAMAGYPNPYYAGNPSMPAGVVPTAYRGPLPAMPYGYPYGQPGPGVPYANPAMDRPGLPVSFPTATGTSPETVQQMVGILRTSLYPSQREWSADYLAKLDWRAHPQVLPALLAAAKEDPAPTVRAACTLCLGRMSVNPELVSGTLQGLKADPDAGVRQAAEETLAHFTPAAGPAPTPAIQPVSSAPWLPRTGQ